MNHLGFILAIIFTVWMKAIYFKLHIHSPCIVWDAESCVDHIYDFIVYHIPIIASVYYTSSKVWNIVGTERLPYRVYSCLELCIICYFLWEELKIFVRNVNEKKCQ